MSKWGKGVEGVALHAATFHCGVDETGVEMGIVAHQDRPNTLLRLQFPPDNVEQPGQGGFFRHRLAERVPGVDAGETQRRRLDIGTLERFNDGILLTGDAQLAQAARRNGLSVHGVLWVIDQLKQEKVCEYAILTKALITWRQDSSVFLPEDEIMGRLSLFVPQDDLSRTSDFGPCNVRDAIPAEYSKGKVATRFGEIYFGIDTQV